MVISAAGLFAERDDSDWTLAEVVGKGCGWTKTQADAQKALVMTQHICCVSKMCRLSNKWADSAKIRDTLTDADRIWTLTSTWFLSCGSGAHFDRCAYNIDLTQYWILEYIFSRWSSNSCAVSAKTCWVSTNTRWWLSKIYRVSKNLLSQQKSADSAKNMLLTWPESKPQ